MSTGAADWDEGQRLLELTEEEADRLFTEPYKAEMGFKSNAWPLNFARRYEMAQMPEERANATVARIEHFIKTKGRE